MMMTKSYFVDQPHVMATDPRLGFSMEDKVLESLGVIANYSEACRLALLSTDPASRRDVVTWLKTINDAAHGVAEAMRAGPASR
jgi:hypothetical protein